MAGIPTEEEIRKRWWDTESAIRDLDAKIKEMQEALRIFLVERDELRRIIMQYYPNLVPGLSQAKKATKMSLPREWKEVLAIIRAYPELPKEEVAAEVAETYNKNVKDVVEVMKAMFETGLIAEKDGKVFLNAFV